MARTSAGGIGLAAIRGRAFGGLVIVGGRPCTFVGLGCRLCRRPALCDAHPRRTQQPVVQQVSGLDDLNDGAAGLLRIRHFEHGFVVMRIEPLAHGIEFDDAVALEHRLQFSRGQLHALEQDLERTILLRGVSRHAFERALEVVGVDTRDLYISEESLQLVVRQRGTDSEPGAKYS